MKRVISLKGKSEGLGGWWRLWLVITASMLAYLLLVAVVGNGSFWLAASIVSGIWAFMLVVGLATRWVWRGFHPAKSTDAKELD
jgi:hypothetical protein